MNTIDKQSVNVHKEAIEQLKAILPHLFSDEGNLDPRELELFVKKYPSSLSGKYEFNWAGKLSAKRNAYKPSRANLKPDKERSVEFDTTENLIIEGDNLEVLKLLQKSYSNKVKCIYIDPPYNTGNDFVYSDDFSEGKQAYWEKNGTTENGVKVDTNTESQGRYHSNWLNMMYPRLLLARQLLREDGVIFISIDDNEVHNLRKVLDGVFGEENFVAQIGVQLNPRGRHLDKFVAKTYEYLLLYTKNYDENEAMVGTEKEGKMLDEYNQEDEKGRFRLLGLRNRNQAFNPVTRPTLYFPIYIDTNTGKVSIEETKTYTHKVFPDTPDDIKTCWTWSKDKVTKENNNLIAKQQSKDEWRIYRKDYLHNENGIATTLPKSLWLEKELNNDYGKKAVKELFGESVMDFPKSVGLITKILCISTKEGDIVLDFFAGSGTTAQAVMELNRDDGGNRKYILVQLPEATDPNSEAHKAGYKTIADICVERARRVAERIRKEEGDKLLGNGKTLDTGFKTFKLAPSFFPENLFQPDPEKSEAENVGALNEYIEKAKKILKFEFIEEELFYEVLLKDGFELSFTREKLTKFTGNNIYRVSDSEKEAILCLDSEIKDASLKLLEEYKDSRFICLERAVDTTKKWNLKTVFGQNLWVV